MSTDLERLERLAERLRAVEPMRPSPQARIRGWNLTQAAIQRAHRGQRVVRSPLRLVLALAAAAAVLIVGTVAVSAQALPDSPLYPVKGALENVRGLLALTPTDRFTYHLELASTRLDEAQAMFASRRDDLAVIALSEEAERMNQAAAIVASLESTDQAEATELKNRLEQAIDVHDQQLAGLLGDVTNPQALSAIAAARDRAQSALDAARAAVQGNGSNGAGAGGHGSGSPPAGHGPSPK